MNIRLVTVVWGASFVDIFLRVTVRTLLAEGNMAALAVRHHCKYQIYTTEQDAKTLRSSPHFQELQRIVDTEILTFDHEGFDLSTHATHWHVWRRAYELAKRDREIIFLIIPDAIFAEGTLSRWAELFERGYRAVWTAGPQVVLETGLEEIERRFPQTAAADIRLSVLEIHQMMIRHLHPLIAIMMRDSSRWLPHPEAVLREVPGNGLTMRILGSHPFCFDPNYFSVTDAFSPLDRLEAIAFDQARFICLETMTKYSGAYYRPMRMDDTQLSNLGSWIDWFCAPSDMLKSYFSYRFLGHASTDERAFRRAEQALGVYASQFRITGALYRVARAMKDAGCERAAQFLALAHFDGRLRRRWTIKGPITILAPTDAGLDLLSAERREALLQPGHEEALMDAVFAHIVPGTVELAPGDKIRTGSVAEATTGDGSTATFAAAGADALSAMVISGPIRCDSCTIYVIDRHLLTKVDRPEPRKAAPGVLPDRWAPPPLRVGVPSPPSAKKTEEPALPRVPRTPRSILIAVARRLYRPFARVPFIQTTVHELHAYYRRKKKEAERPPEPMPIPRPPDDLVGRLADLQAVRVLTIIAEIMRFYQGKVVTVAPELPTLAFAEERVSRVGLSDADILKALYRLVEQSPEFADAWLEIAYIHLDRGEFEEACRCADRCVRGALPLPTPPGKPPVAVLALYVRAKALEGLSRWEEAAQAYQDAFRRGGHPGIVRVHFARLLRRLGRHDEALAHFYDGLKFDVLSRDLQKVDFEGLPQRLAALRRAASN